MSRKKKKKYTGKRRGRKKNIRIPEKIHEVISYLAFSFSSKLLEREDNSQFLYLKYVELIRKNPLCEQNKPGWFFLRFKWLLLTRYANNVKRVNREWEVALKNNPCKSEIQGTVGHLEEDNADRHNYNYEK